MIKKIRSLLSLVDLLHFCYLLFLILLVSCSASKNTFFFRTFFLYLALLILLLIMVAFRPKIKNQRIIFLINFCYPIASLLIIFESLIWLLPALNPMILIENRFDPILYSIDTFLVATHPVIWLNQLAHPIITEIMYLCYTYYFFLPFILMTLLFLHKKYHEIQDMFFILALSFYLSYLGYIFVPACGPRFYLKLDPLAGLYLAENLRNIINFLEPNKYDIFPSVHQLINLEILLFAWIYERKFFYLNLPAAIGITISLFYCQYHYLIDVIAGSVLAVFFFFMGRFIIVKAKGKFRDHWTTGDTRRG